MGLPSVREKLVPWVERILRKRPRKVALAAPSMSLLVRLEREKKNML